MKKIVVCLLFILVTMLASAGEKQESLQFVVQQVSYYKGVQVFQLAPMRPASLLVVQTAGPKVVGRLDVMKCKSDNRVTVYKEPPLTITEEVLDCNNGIQMTVKGVMYP